MSNRAKKREKSAIALALFGKKIEIRFGHFEFSRKKVAPLKLPKIYHIHVLHNAQYVRVRAVYVSWIVYSDLAAKLM